MSAIPSIARCLDAYVDFANPPASQKPISALEELCQNVLLSPEVALIE